MHQTSSSGIIWNTVRSFPLIKKEPETRTTANVVSFQALMALWHINELILHCKYTNFYYIIYKIIENIIRKRSIIYAVISACVNILLFHLPIPLVSPACLSFRWQFLNPQIGATVAA